MDRLQRFLAAAIMAAICLSAEGAGALSQSEDAVQKILGIAQQAVLERHYQQAVRDLQSALREYPNDNRLRLGLGQTYLSEGANRQAASLFTEILRDEPNNRSANLELAFALGYLTKYESSDRIYQSLLGSNSADEAASIGLASNLLHQHLPREAEVVVKEALAIHPNSLRLQELNDRIANGQFGGDEQEPEPKRNLLESRSEYFNDSSGSHSWRTAQRFDFALAEGLGNRVNLEQQFQRSRDDLSEEVKTFAEQLRWRPHEFLLLDAGGGAVRFNNGDVHSIYEASAAVQPTRHLLIGSTFERIPIIPNAEATEHRLTAQGWEAFTGWTQGLWQINTRLSRQHYTDRNIGSRESGELTRVWKTPRLTFETGYRYRHQGFSLELAHGYFTPDNYQSHLAMFGVSSHFSRWYRGEFLARGGAESIAASKDYSPAWEFELRNQVLMRDWTVELDYSKYHLTQDTGAFRADAGQFAVVYHF